MVQDPCRSCRHPSCREGGQQAERSRSHPQVAAPQQPALASVSWGLAVRKPWASSRPTCLSAATSAWLCASEMAVERAAKKPGVTWRTGDCGPGERVAGMSWAWAPGGKLALLPLTCACEQPRAAPSPTHHKLRAVHAVAAQQGDVLGGVCGGAVALHPNEDHGRKVSPQAAVLVQAVEVRRR